MTVVSGNIARVFLALTRWLFCYSTHIKLPVIRSNLHALLRDDTLYIKLSLSYFCDFASLTATLFLDDDNFIPSCTHILATTINDSTRLVDIPHYSNYLPACGLELFVLACADCRSVRKWCVPHTALEQTLHWKLLKRGRERVDLSSGTALVRIVEVNCRKESRAIWPA